MDQQTRTILTAVLLEIEAQREIQRYVIEHLSVHNIAPGLHEALFLGLSTEAARYNALHELISGLQSS